MNKPTLPLSGVPARSKDVEPAPAHLPATPAGRHVETPLSALPTMNCSRCFQPLTCPPELAGQHVACPYCGLQFEVPSAQSFPSSSPQVPAGSLPDAPLPEYQQHGPAVILRFVSPLLLALTLIWAACPWTEVSVNVTSGRGSLAMLDQSGYQAVTGTVLFSPAVEALLDVAEQIAGQADSPPTFRAAKLLGAALLCLACAALSGFMAPVIRSRVPVFVLASLALLLLFIQERVGLPLERMLLEKAVGSTSADSAAALEAERMFRVRYTPWYWLSVACVLGAVASELLILATKPKTSSGAMTHSRKAMPPGTKVGLWLAILLLFALGALGALVAGLRMASRPNHIQKDPQFEAEKDRPLTPLGEAEFFLTAEQFREEFNADEAATTEKYRDKIIQLTGVLVSMDTEPNDDGEILIWVKAGPEFNHVVICRSPEREVWKKALPGQTIKFRGNVGRGALAGLIHSRIDDVSGSPPPSLTANAFSAEYLANPEKMRDKYRGKFLILSGEIGRTKWDKFDGSLSMTTGDPNLTILCQCSLKGQRRLTMLKSGQKVKVLGKFLGSSDKSDEAEFVDCILLEVER